jgi:hypothetical protein
MKLLFSIPAHEGNDIICNVIENIQKFIKDPIIVIHTNQSFANFDTTIPTRYNNVYVNPNRLHLIKYQSMLPILFSNFEFAEQFDYDYHCIFHTNQLLIKHGLEDYIQGKNMSFEYFYDIGSIRSREMFNASNSNIESKIGNETFNSHLEGTFYKKDIFKKVYDFVNKDMPNVINSEHAVEETVIPTIAYYLFVDKNKLALTYLKHTEQAQLSIDDVKGLLEKNKPATIFKGVETNTDCVFSIKPVHRTMDNPLRTFISDL